MPQLMAMSPACQQRKRRCIPARHVFYAAVVMALETIELAAAAGVGAIGHWLAKRVLGGPDTARAENEQVKTELRNEIARLHQTLSAQSRQLGELRLFVGIEGGNGMQKQMSDLITEVKGLRHDLHFVVVSAAEQRGSRRITDPTQ